MKHESLRGTVKERAQRLVDNLPEDANWDDLMHQIYVLQSIEKGLNDSENDRLVDVVTVRRRFGLDS